MPCAFGALLLTACTLPKTLPTSQCPRVTILQGAHEISFVETGLPSYTVVLEKSARRCREVGPQRLVNFALRLRVDGSADLQQERVPAPIFAALVRPKEDHLVAHQIFFPSLSVNRTQILSGNIRFILPEGRQEADYEVIIGLIGEESP